MLCYIYMLAEYKSCTSSLHSEFQSRELDHISATIYQ